MPYKYEKPPSVFILIKKPNDAIIGAYLTRAEAESIKAKIDFDGDLEIIKYYDHPAVSHTPWITTVTPTNTYPLGHNDPLII